MRTGRRLRKTERERGTLARRTRELLRTGPPPNYTIHLAPYFTTFILHRVAANLGCRLAAPCDPRPLPRRLASNPISPPRDEISAAKLVLRREKGASPSPRPRCNCVAVATIRSFTLIEFHKVEPIRVDDALFASANNV